MSKTKKIDGPLSQTSANSLHNPVCTKGQILVMNVPPLESLIQCPVAEVVAEFSEQIIYLASTSLEEDSRLEHLILQRVHPNRIAFYLFNAKYGAFEVYRSEVYWDPEAI